MEMAEVIGKKGQTSESVEVKVEGLATSKLKVHRLTLSSGSKEEKTKMDLRSTV